MGEVINLDESRPHVVIDIGDRVELVIPERYLQDVAEGKLLITEMPRSKEISQSIVRDWLSDLG